MEQLTQNLKDGAMQLLEVPFPALLSGQILVRNYFSLISAGTEGKTVKDARLGYIGKARARKEEVKKVIQSAKTNGWMNTYKMVMNKLDAPSSLGYSCAGKVIAVADDVTGFKAGDLVACGGSGAVHAEVVAIPVNLCVKLKEETDLRQAAFTTLGAIALQGLRQADLRLSENCVVIGLGLVGQLTVLLLKASGVKVIAIDIDENQVLKAKALGADLAIQRNDSNLEDHILHLTDGFGADAVIITASTDSSDPIELAGSVCRRKGKVIIVGSVPTGFTRKNYYNKELELKMSCSYGPGRYDTEYEEQGIDYPIGYVRWTENRNMQAFADMISNGQLTLEKIITHQFDFKEAPKAYDLILDKSESFSGIILKYDTAKPLKQRIDLVQANISPGEPALAFIGAGSFAQNMLLPNLQSKAKFIGITTARPNNARYLADKYGFAYCTDSADEIFKDKNVNTVFVVTRHNSHFEYVLKALQHGKHVFVEKPLCFNVSELKEIKSAWKDSGKMLMVGFNRRFAPLISNIKNAINPEYPVAINYRINAGNVPSDHWTQDPKVGGGRIIGEVCHFIDLCRYITGSPILTVAATTMKSAATTDDTLNIQLQFANGSVANISYFANGSKEMAKENLEVFSAGNSYVLDDFKSLTIYSKNKKVINNPNQDKGHKAEIDAFLNSIKSGTIPPISFGELYESMLATFKTIDSIQANGERILMNENE
jgi:predicted dehydrogenase/threonine dehydrogenase-like Zn-dependent dehydrogenase